MRRKRFVLHFQYLDNDQKIRFNRTLLALVSYFFGYVLVLLYQIWGIFILSLSRTLALIGISILTNIIYLWIIYKGFNLRFKDPSLTIYQIVTAILFTFLIYYYSSGYRGALLVFFMFALTFGFFRLNGKQFVYLSLFVLIGYSITLYLIYLNHPEYFDLKHDILRGLVLILLLIWFSILGTHQFRLRLKLKNTLNELKELNQKLIELATTDELTGLYNRREMIRRLYEEYARSIRYKSHFSVAIIDLDHFKCINDSYGHEVGDRVLKAVGATLKSTMRDVDSVGRFGGEEFLALLPNTKLTGALSWAERARKAIEAYEYEGLRGQKVTASFGIAELKQAEKVDSLLRRADIALYEAKLKGRNRVEVA